MSASVMRIGLLGYGAIAAEHARALQGCGCELAAVMGPDPEGAAAFAAEHGVRHATGDQDAVLTADDVDAVVIASPNAVHAEQTLAALAAGKHVLAEVPLAMSLADAERVASAAEVAEGQLMVCHTQRFWAPVRHLRGLVDDGALRVHHLAARTFMRRRENVGWTGRRRSWVDHALWHHGSHAVDTALFLLGDAVEHVSAEVGRRDPDTGHPLDVGLVLRTRSGALASLALSYNSMLGISDLVAIGEDETFRLERGELHGSAGPVMTTEPAAMQDEALRVQDEAFVGAVLAGEPVRPTAADVLAVYRVLQEASERITS